MDLQKLFDAMSVVSRSDRSNYHLTLGQLISFLEDAGSDTPVCFDDGSGIGSEDSYRGYYHDLAFSPSPTASTASDVLTMCWRATSDVYEGYKGGEYTYGPDTPLWCASYGNCGPAIVACHATDDRIVLITKEINP